MTGEHYQSQGKHRPVTGAEKLANELKVEIRKLTFDANRQLTALASVIQEIEQLAEKVMALRSHNNDIVHAGGLLSNAIPMELKQTGSRLHLVVQILEEYENLT